MSTNLKNLDDVEKYVTENMPGWKINRGKRSWMERLRPAAKYEVIQLFCPNENQIPYAEFWQGYNEFFPEIYTGFCEPGHKCFHYNGNLNYAMRHAIEEKERLDISPKIRWAVRTAVKHDPVLGNVCGHISNSSISDMRRDNNCVFWDVDCKCFHCSNENQRCVLSVSYNDNGFNVIYRLETWYNNHYELDAKNSINVGEYMV